MSSKWAFIGGVLAGIAGVFTAAAVAVELECTKSGGSDTWMNSNGWRQKAKAGRMPQSVCKAEILRRFPP